jgi:hypothetical protein
VADFVFEELELEEFDKTARPAPSKPTLTIQRRGTMGLSGASYTNLGEPEAITLHYDPKRRIMVIRADSPDKHNAIIVRKQSASNSYLFSGTAFANHYGIPLGEGRRYSAEPYGEGTLIVDLNQEPANVSKPRREAE